MLFVGQTYIIEYEVYASNDILYSNADDADDIWKCWLICH